MAGYIVLSPDLPSDTAEDNHILYLPKEEETTKYSLLTAFKCFRGFVKNVILFEGCIDEIEEIAEKDKALEKTFDEIYSKIESNLVPLDYCLAVIRSLANNNYSKFKFKAEHIDNMQRNTILYSNRRFTSVPLYKYMREFNSNKVKLNKFQQRIVEKYVIEGKLNGSLLEKSQVHTYKIICKELDKHMSKYGTNVKTAISRFKETINEKGLLKYFPESFLLSTGSVDQLTVTLERNVYEPFMEYCPDRMQRWNAWRAYNNRASQLIDSKISNSVIIDEIRSSRKKFAETLGYRNYVELTMQTKMAKSLNAVSAMISTLNEKNKSAFEENFEELNEFVSKEDINKLEPWDIPFCKRQIIKEKFPIDENTVRQYFTLESALKGIFSLTKKLFNIDIEEVQQKDFNAWHPDVRLFRLISPKGFLGSFFFDPYARPNDKKLTPPRVELILNRSDALRTKPLCHLITNFQKPLSAKYLPQLYYNDVYLLFRSFGNILQHLVNEMPFHEISGMNNLEWDRVNLCSDFMGLWFLHDYNVVASCSSNVIDKSPLPKDIFLNIRESKLHFYSFHLKEELYKSALDVALHVNKDFWKDVMTETWKAYMSPFELHKLDNHVCSFSEIFCENLGGFYYSKKWSEMLAADAFLAFKEAESSGEDVRAISTRFAETILSLGGGCSGEEVFRLFRGRDPSPDALLVINDLLRDSVKGKDSEQEQLRSKTID
ncbi:putative cytosolic oligopeptidase A-like protein [Dinothrombium tinctorium]|uniref:Putative cytosolic oligopeptidase A-like protein n=1 Tax=Dinothrombium tinctorium TaxID=1965070 RepID=A0A3S4RIL9_9ACAR|nr:putative cytosolic oligopeptidase A-like protein [Dinothrombium tinctorium]